MLYLVSIHTISYRIILDCTYFQAAQAREEGGASAARAKQRVFGALPRLPAALGSAQEV